MQIIVLGAHRSGTSLVTRLVNMMGAYFAIGESALGSNIENPKGFWERWDVIEANNQLLRHYGCEWDQLADWSFKETLPKKDEKALVETNKSIESILLELDANRPWVVKDPRMCLTYPFWKSKLDVPVIVCVYRNPLEVSRSLKTRNEFTFSQSMALWEYYATGITNAIRNVPTVYVSHSDMLSKPVETVKKLLADLQANDVQSLRMPTDKEITSFIDPDLYRSRDKDDALDDMATAYQKRLMAYVSGKEKPPTALQLPTELATDTINTLSQYRTLQGKMEVTNRKIAEVEQARDELENQLSLIHDSNEDVRREYEAQVNKERADNAFIKQSRSWKIGSAIVNTGRTLTFKSSNNA